MEFQLIDQNNLSSNYIAGFFDHQYLWRESFNVVDFFHIDSHQEMETLRVILLVTCGQGGQPSYQLAYHHRRCSVKKVVLRNFAKFTGKHLCQSLFFKKETLTGVFL